MKLTVFIYLLIIISVECIGQNGNNHYSFWNQKSLSGALGFKVQYRNQHQVFGSGFEENTQGTLISGGLLLESRSFIIHPNLMALDIDVEYNPEKLDEQFLIMPDRAEVRTLKRLNVRTTFFEEKDISLNAFVNLNQNYINRESFTNSRTNRMFWGGGLYYKNKVLPFSVTYQEGNWDQTEIETGRTYSYWQRNILGKMSKSFTSHDKHNLTLSYDEYIREEYNINPLKNQVNYASLNSSFYFDSKKNYTLNTIVSNFNQIGITNLNRLQVFANMIMKLPQDFRLMGNYNYFDNQYTLYRLNQHRAKLNLGHQLFSSLKTNLFVEYGNNKHSVYKEVDIRAGFDVNYTKKIPKGQLNISYMFYNRDFKRDSDPVSLKVINEEHFISDDQILLLNKPYVETETVLVKDITGTMVYELNLDYILLEHNNYIEIQRIPGGQIADNSTILVDYSTLLSGAYKYNLNNQLFSASVILFNRLIELYYRRAKQDYNYHEQTEFIALNYYLQNVCGVQFTVGFARFGVEYDDYKSSIIPYQLVRYFANLQWRFKNKLLLSLVGNVRDYITIGERKNEYYADISGRVAYSFNPKTKLNLELGYRDQKGYYIDLDLFTARTEFIIIIRKVFFTVGLEVYRRNYLNRETINFNGAYFSIVRKF